MKLRFSLIYKPRHVFVSIKIGGYVNMVKFDVINNTDKWTIYSPLPSLKVPLKFPVKPPTKTGGFKEVYRTLTDIRQLVDVH